MNYRLTYKQIQVTLELERKYKSISIDVTRTFTYLRNSKALPYNFCNLPIGQKGSVNAFVGTIDIWDNSEKTNAQSKTSTVHYDCYSSYAKSAGDSDYKCILITVDTMEGISASFHIHASTT